MHFRIAGTGRFTGRYHFEEPRPCVGMSGRLEIVANGCIRRFTPDSPIHTFGDRLSRGRHRRRLRERHWSGSDTDFSSQCPGPAPGFLVEGYLRHCLIGTEGTAQRAPPLPTFLETPAPHCGFCYCFHVVLWNAGTGGLSCHSPRQPRFLQRGFFGVYAPIT